MGDDGVQTLAEAGVKGSMADALGEGGAGKGVPKEEPSLLDLANEDAESEADIGQHEQASVERREQMAVRGERRRRARTLGLTNPIDAAVALFDRLGEVLDKLGDRAQSEVGEAVSGLDALVGSVAETVAGVRQEITDVKASVQSLRDEISSLRDLFKKGDTKK